MRRIITFIIIFTLFIGNFNTVYAQAINETEETPTESNEEVTTTPSYSSVWSENFPDINSSSGIIMDVETGSVLYGKNVDNIYYPASITKILTALLALEHSSMNEIVTFSHDAVFNVELNSSRIGIDVGEQLTMEECLYAILLASANEVSYAVAEHIAGDIPSFSRMMNEKAKELGAKNTNFVNPHGLPDPDHYTTAYDMAVISKAAMENKDFREITQTRVYIIPPTNIQEETRYLANHHKFINQDINLEGAIGGKTGWTTLSQYTLVTFAERNGMTLVSVIMNCPSIQDEYGDTAKLLDHAFNNFSLYNINDMATNLGEDVEFFTKYQSFFNKSNTPLNVNENGKLILPSNLDINDAERLVMFEPLERLEEGENTIGSVVYSYSGNSLGKTDIIYNNSKSDSLLSDLYLNPADIITEDLSNTANSDAIEEVNNSHMPLIIGVGVGIIVLGVGLVIIYNLNVKRKIRRKIFRNRFKGY